MHLTLEDKDALMERFPDIKLCYETKIDHNKVLADYYCLIPKGKKFFLWITYFKNLNKAAFLIEVNKGNIEDIRHIEINIEKEEVLGSIFYGTLFSKNHFAIEDIYYYKGESLEYKNNSYKLDIFKRYFNKNSQNNKNIILGIPFMSEDINEIHRMKNLVSYSVFSIQHKKYSQTSKKTFFEFANNFKNDKLTQLSFFVEADNQNDIYHCFYGKNKIYHSTLYIPDYKTSVMMNKLFRNIKENDCLDALEESDTEEEFENIDEDKFLLHKTYIIDCKYNTRFKKWYPVKISNNKYSVQNKNDIMQVENEKVAYKNTPYNKNQKYKKYK